jgi:hypothetical protein
MLIPLTHAKKLIDLGYSLLVSDDQKRPIGSWKECQEKALTKDQFEQRYYSPKANYVGFLTGYNEIEVIDVDLKVFATLKEQNDFWNEFLQLLKDNIDDFNLKFTIYKTINQGYHILYKTKNVQGNSKIARLKNHSEAVIESRGKGGYCVVYTNNITDLTYLDVKHISDKDREILWTICKMYNWTGDEDIKQDVSDKYESTLSPWKDYNERVSIWDIISDDFKIVSKTQNQDIIKRNGGTSPHSGYIYRDSGCMYLFSTGTIYPHEELISPFKAYTYKHHNGDFTAAAREIYGQGYGSRKGTKITLQPIELKVNIERVKFPIDVFDEEIQQYIVQSSQTLGLSIDYMGCAFLWSLSVCIGNSFNVEIKPGWRETATLWLAVVGKPGIGKTPSLNQIIYPLQKLNIRKQKEFQKEYAKFVEFEKLDKEQKKFAEDVKRPKSEQFIVGDITLEALIDLHETNPNCIGVFKDELAGWFKDMNKYRAGSDLEFWLSSWNGQSISLNRKTAKSAFVDKPFIPVIGGIQPDVFEQFATGVNKENGFIDRILISYPELHVDKYNTNIMHHDVLRSYETFLIHLKESLQINFFKVDDKGEIMPQIARFSNEANDEWIRIHDKISDLQNSDDENEYMKSMLPKQKSYIPRFAMILNILMSSYAEDMNANLITKEAMLKAERLSDYFINMSKLVKQDAQEKADLRKLASHGTNKYDQFVSMYKSDIKLNRTTASEILQVSRRTVLNWITKIENK